MAKAGNQGLVRINNQNAIIEYLRDHGPLSRADLAKCLKISKPTVSTNVEALVERGILHEVGLGTTSVGKKPTLLEFNKNHKLILAVDLSRENSKFALGNLGGDILAQVSICLSKSKSVTSNQKAVIKSFEALIKKVGVNKSSVEHIVIASPGIFSKGERGQLLNPQFEHLQAIQMDDLLEQYFAIKPLIRNDINMAALGETFFGNGKNHCNLAYVSVGLGVGAGLIMNKALYLGSRRAAGEIGFTIPLNGKNANGTYVDLENTIGEKAIEKRLALESALHAESLVFLTTARPSFSSFINAVKRNDAYCKSLAMEMIDHLSLAIGNMSVVLDFELVVVGGSILSLGSAYIKVLEEKVNEITPLKTEVKASKLVSAEIYGGLKTGMDLVFESLVKQ